MNKRVMILRLCIIIVAVLAIVLSVRYFITGEVLPAIQPLLLAIMMALIAINHVQQADIQKQKKFGAVFWLFIVAAVANLVTAITQLAS